MDKLYKYGEKYVFISAESRWTNLVTVEDSEGKLYCIGREKLVEVKLEDNAKLNITSEEQEE